MELGTRWQTAITPRKSRNRDFQQILRSYVLLWNGAATSWELIMDGCVEEKWEWWDDGQEAPEEDHLGHILLLYHCIPLDWPNYGIETIKVEALKVYVS